MAKKIAKKVKIVKETKKAKQPVKKDLVVKSSFTKSQIINELTERAEVAKKQAICMFETLAQIIEAHLSKKGPGAFVFPGLAKFRVIKKPATKARKGTNPFTGEPTTFAAKPARMVVKIKPLKKLKDLVK